MTFNHVFLIKLRQRFLWGSLIPYLWILGRAIQQRTWNLYGVIDLFSFGFFLWMLWNYSVGRPLKYQKKGWLFLEVLVRGFLWGLPVFVAMILWYEPRWNTAFDLIVGALIYAFPLGYTFVAPTSTVWWVLLLAFGLAAILRFRLHRSAAQSILAAIFVFYASEAYWVNQYEEGMKKPVPLPSASFLKIIPFSEIYKRGRQLVIDSLEKTAYISFQDGMDNVHQGGILKYNLLTHQPLSFHNTIIGDRFVMSPDGQFLYFSSYNLNPQLVRLATQSFEIAPIPFSERATPILLPDLTDSVAWLSPGVLVMNQEVLNLNRVVPQDPGTLEASGSGLFFLNLNRSSLASASFKPLPLKIPPFSRLNYGITAIPARNEGFSLITGNHKVLLVHFSLDQKISIIHEWTGYSVEIYYSSLHHSLFIPFLDQDLMMQVTIDGFKTTSHPIPRGIREVLDGPDGNLILLNYLHGSLSIYDPQQKLLKTVVAPPYTEAMAIGPQTGHLYIATSTALWIYDLKKTTEPWRIPAHDSEDF